MAFAEDAIPADRDGPVDGPLAHVARAVVLNVPIGVYDHERGRVQRVRVTAAFDAPVAEAVFRTVAREAFENGHTALVETAADRIAREILARSGAEIARVRVEKLDVFPDATVGVELERRRV